MQSVSVTTGLASGLDHNGFRGIGLHDKRRWRVDREEMAMTMTLSLCNPFLHFSKTRNVQRPRQALRASPWDDLNAKGEPLIPMTVEARSLSHGLKFLKTGSGFRVEGLGFRHHLIQRVRG
jgi:hypothetical protein